MKKLLAIIRIYTLDALTYRGDVFIFTLTGTIHPFILLIIWLAVIASGGNPPLNRQEFLLYYFAVLIIKVWTTAWHAREWSAKIRLGELSPYLLKPASFQFFLLGNNIGEKLLKSFYLIPIIFLAGLALNVNPPQPSLWTILLLIVSWLLAAVLTFTIELSILLTTFWLDDIESLDNFVVFSSYIFSGQFIPLIAFPPVIQSISLFLPFRYILSFPVEIFTNRLIGLNIAAGLGLQIFWCIVMIFLCRILWKKGLVRYSAVGA
jgi:ABC-2 type transport system permease protein